MFEKELEAKFKGIFGVKKVTYDEPGESQEQGCIFVEIETSHNKIQDGRAKARVEGTGIMFGPNDKMPFGFFSKRIAKADLALTKDLFFYDFEENTKRYQNIVQRKFSFVYFFNGQYDPDTGSITEVDFIEE